jgi:hypothetical protein
MNRNDLQTALRRANALGLNMPTLQALIAVSLGFWTKSELQKQTGNKQAWKCVIASPLFDVVDERAYLSEKGEETLNKIAK